VSGREVGPLRGGDGLLADRKDAEFRERPSSTRIGRRALVRRDYESKYLLTGFVRCTSCGGSITVVSRKHGKRRAYFYGCLTNWKRGVERHQRLIAAAQSALFAPIRAVLNRLSDTAFLAALETQAGPWLVRDAMRAIQILPSLISAERAALGLTQVEIAIEDRREHHAWADRIAADPKAVHLAIELLNQVARPGPT